MKKRSIKLLIFLIITINVSGCEPLVRVSKMVPDVDYSKHPITDKSLRIAEVTGGAESIPYGELKNTDFKEALLKTMEKAGFIINENGDYDLYVEIKSQQWLRTGFGIVTKHLLIEYRLIEKNSNQEVWKEHIFTQYSVESKGGYPVQNSTEGAVRDSLAQLVKKLQLFFSK